MHKSPRTASVPPVSLILLGLGFLIVGLVYSVSTPIYEVADELRHYEFVKHVADGRGLPIQQTPPAANAAEQEGSQPPLYYVVTGLLTSWIDTGSPDDLYQLNPHASVGYPGSDGNKNLVVHTAKEDFPFSGPSLAVHLVRLFSLLLGLTAVVATYFIGLEVWPGRRDLATAAAALVAVIPGFLFIASAVNNDNAVTAISTLSLLAMLRLIRGPGFWKPVVALAVLVPLGALAKLSGLLLVPFAVGCLAYVAYRRRGLRLLVAGGGLIGVAWLAVAGWWYLRNLVLYGEFLGTTRMLEILGGRVPPLGVVEVLQVSLEEWEGLRWSFWGVFGWFNVIPDRWFYLLFDVLSVMAVAGLLLALLPIGRRHLQIDRSVLVLLGAWPAAVFVAYLRYNQIAMASQGRLLYPAIAAISVFVVLGLASYRPWLSHQLARVAPVVLGVLLAGVAVTVPLGVIMPAYAKPSALSEKDVPANLKPLGINFGGRMELIGYEPLPQELRLGEVLPLVLYWRSIAPMDVDYSIFVHLLGRGEEKLSWADRYPGRGTLPTRQWRPGDIIREEFRMSIVKDGTAPMAAPLEVGLYRLETGERLSATNREGVAVGNAIILARLPVGVALADKTERKVVWDFAGEVGIVDVAVSSHGVKPGGKLNGAITWKALKRPDKDYTIFVQLLDPKREVRPPYGLVAQWDSQPQGGFYPTSLWPQGEIAKEPFVLDLPPDLPDGQYELIVGLYIVETGKRLTVGGGDHVVLKQILVKEGVLQ